RPVLRAEVLAEAGDSVQRDDVEAVVEAERDVVATHEEWKREVPHRRDREGEEPPGTVVGTRRVALGGEQIDDVADIQAGRERLDLAWEASAFVEQAAR